MKSTNTLYKTEAGQNLLDTLHESFYDARESIHAMIRAIEAAIPAAKNKVAKTELEDKLLKLRDAYEKVGEVDMLVEDKWL